MRLSSTTKILVAFAALKFLLHLYSQLFASYGIFRDELYYTACAEHLSFGYVDHPPFSIWVLAMVQGIFGKSLLVMRLVPALLGGALVWFTGKLVQEMNGSGFAVALASIAVIISPINLGFASVYSMNNFDLLVWVLGYYFIIKLLNTRNPEYWVWLGIALGFGLLNKVSVLWFGTGLLVGLVATKERKWFTTHWPYFSAMIAIVLFSIYILWNFMNDWAHLEFMQEASSKKYGGLSAWTFISGQLLINNPLNLPLLICGLVFLMFTEKGSKYILPGIIFITTFLILVLNGNSKSEYLAASLSVLYAGGAVLVGAWVKNKVWLQATAILLLSSGIVLAPLAAPLLPVEGYIKFAKQLGVGGDNNEGKEEGVLPQFYADMHGWEQKAAAVAKVYHSLPKEDQEKCAIFGDNYGHSGCIDYYSEKYKLPKSIGKHNSYWIWGPGKYKGEIVIVMSNEVGDKEELFEEVTDMAIIDCQYCMPYEDNLHVYLCKKPKADLTGELWATIKSYD